MKILAVSDTHFNTIEDIQILEQYKNEVDYCFCLGEVSLGHLLTLKKIFNDHIYGILGNHDRFDYLQQANIPDLDKTLIKLDDFSIIGLSGSWKYKEVSEYILLTDKESIEITKKFKKANILISHDTYKGFCETIVNCSHPGLMGITKYLTPKLLSNECIDINLHGHYHTNHSSYFKKTNVVGVFPFSIITIDKIDNKAKITNIKPI